MRSSGCLGHPAVQGKECCAVNIEALTLLTVDAYSSCSRSYSRSKRLLVILFFHTIVLGLSDADASLLNE